MVRPPLRRAVLLVAVPAGCAALFARRSFEGELVLQDPNDEPASELLARVRASSGEAHGNTHTGGGKMPALTPRKSPK